MILRSALGLLHVVYPSNFYVPINLEDKEMYYIRKTLLLLSKKNHVIYDNL